MTISRRLTRTLLVLALGFPAWLAAAPVATEQAEAELVAEHLSLKPGETPNWVALRLKPAPGWHIYWENPGDSGLPTRLAWQLPDGVSAGTIQWPFPHRYSLGGLTNYGYGEETLHLVPMTVAPGTRGPVELAATAKWLVCKDLCIPGEAQLTLTLPVSDEPARADPAWSAAFAEARARLPKPAPDWEARFSVTDGDFSLAIAGTRFPAGSEAAFYPIAGDLVRHSAVQRVVLDAAGLRLSQSLSSDFVAAADTVEGVLVIRDPAGTETAFEFAAQPGAVEPVAATNPVDPATAATSATLSPTLPLALALALAGGLILNLMPCVFPVLSLKALSVMQARDEGAARHRAHALAYTGGVLASFALVAGMLMALRAGGAALGWGFQLQSPPFVAALVYVMFALGLSLAGIVQFGAGFMGVGQKLTEKPGLAGSFFTGVLAVVVASPCTAPFMGGALGFALTQPPAVSLAIFLALGIGLALPFLLLGFVPRLAGLLPRPGAWMETFKQVLAFPMFLTAVWLLWVLGGLTDRDGMAIALVGLVALALALWLTSRPGGGIARLFGYAALIGSLTLLAHPALDPATAARVAARGADSEAWSPERFEALRAEGRTVFVDFTADWCISCKVNERLALKSGKVRRAFAEHDVVFLVGDWTRADPEITAVLQAYGRSGVPLYLLSKNGADPEVLPQVLTPDLVVEALR